MCRLTETVWGTLGIEFPTHPCPAFCVPKNCRRLPHRSGFGIFFGFEAGLGFWGWVRILGLGYGSGLGFWGWVRILGLGYGSGLGFWGWVRILGLGYGFGSGLRVWVRILELG